MYTSVGVVFLRLGHGTISQSQAAAVVHLRGSVSAVETLSVENFVGSYIADLSVDKTVGFPENLGYARAINRGIEAVSGEVIIVLTSDAEPSLDTLTLLVASLHPDVGVVGPRIRTSEAHWFGGRWSPYFGWARHYTSDRGEPDWLDGSCLCFRRSTFEAVGHFDEGTFLYVEDAQFCLKAVAAGMKIVLNDRALVTQESGMYGRSGAHGYLIARNEIRTMRALGRLSIGCVVSQGIRAILEGCRSIIGPNRRHHALQSLGMSLGVLHGIGGREGRPPKFLCRVAQIP
jgi:GT2 family glycosyltransferase